MLVAGGGAHNNFLMNRIKYHLPETRIETTENISFSIDSKEAALFALLAYQCITGTPSSLPSCTGATKRTILGKITPGDNFSTLIQKIHR